MTIPAGSPIVPIVSESRVSALVQEAFALQEQDALETGSLGFLGRLLVQATMPHSRPATNEYERSNGRITLSMMAPSKIGLPYGSVPRLLLAWVTTEAVRTKERELVLGDTLSSFMRELELVPTGGRWGSITRLREQMTRLFAASISASYHGSDGRAGINVNVASAYSLWWDPKIPDQASLWQSTVTLGHEFFEEITTRPVPVDMRALQALRRSPLALDLYAWLTWRNSTLRRPTTVPWEALEAQFGSEYSQLRQFRWKLLQALAKVRVAYPEARVEAAEAGLLLHPSPPHVPRRIAGENPTSRQVFHA